MLAIHHVQIAMPPGKEEEARRFFVDVVGLEEMRKPPILAARGGAWFRGGALEIHLGVEEGFRPARKAHPGILTDDLDGLAARLAEAGYDVRADDALPGYRRFHVDDPFGNRLEFLQLAPPTLRDLRPADLGRVLELNQAAVPAVGDLDREGLAALVGMAQSAVVLDVAGEVVGFALALPPRAGYGSNNYRWFSARYDDFVYLDRIAIAPSHQGRGLGHVLYDAVEARTDAPVFLCEVNVRPRNEPSLRFHRARGFTELSEEEPYGDGTRVVMLEKRLR